LPEEGTIALWYKKSLFDYNYESVWDNRVGHRPILPTIGSVGLTVPVIFTPVPLTARTGVGTTRRIALLVGLFTRKRREHK